MTTLSGWTVDWSISPRLISVPGPTTTVTAQDLVDTVRKLEDTFRAMSEKRLLAAEGKAGPGGVTGIVITLQDAQIAFEPRTTIIQSGTVTTADSNGKTLIDTAATFITNGVTRGDMVENHTSEDHATVLAVVSETELRTLPLAGAGDNRYDFGDSYAIFDYENAAVTAGDFFAVDDVGGSIEPTLNTYGVNLTVEQSTSPAAAPASAADIWTAALTEAYPVDGQSSTTPTRLLYAINQMLSEFARTGTIVSIKQRDGSEAFQLTLDSGTAPTSSTQSS